LAAVVKPDALLAWYRKLIANKFDESRFRQRVGRPRMYEEAERLVVQMAKENHGWGYDRIVGWPRQNQEHV
jgi:putative transposase